MKIGTLTFDPVEEAGQIASPDPVGAAEQEVVFDKLLNGYRSGAVDVSSFAVDQVNLGNDFARFYEPGSVESYPFLSPSGRPA